LLLDVAGVAYDRLLIYREGMGQAKG
jgi:hypothetical protein